MSTIAEKRKVKIGSKGKTIWGENIVFLKVSEITNCHGEELWEVIEEGTNNITNTHPSNIRLENELSYKLVKFSEYKNNMNVNPINLVYDNPRKKEKLNVLDIVYFTRKNKFLFYCEDYPDQIRDDVEYLFVKVPRIN